MEHRAAGTGERRWTGFGRTLVAGIALMLALYLGLAYAVDPYDSGRSGLLSVEAVRPQGPRTAAALRGRDPAFAAAILGNSHIQLIEPERLSRATGIPFVQLSVPATGPAEQFALVGWFLRHHPHPQALVIAADEYWCTDDPALPNPKPFPFWLFSDSVPAYLRGLLRWSVLEELIGRLRWLALPERESARRDGWWDYEADYLALGYGEDPRHVAERAAPAPDAPERGRAGPAFPAADRLAAIAASLPKAMPLVLVFPPIHAPGLPRPGTLRAAADAACKAALTRALEGHRASAVLDWRRDRPELHDPAGFFDQRHYRHPLAQRIGAEIAAAIRDLGAQPEGGGAQVPR